MPEWLLELSDNLGAGVVLMLVLWIVWKMAEAREARTHELMLIMLGKIARGDEDVE